jgi:hypothetical protein
MKRPRSKWYEKSFPQRWEVALWLLLIALAITLWVLRWGLR